MRDLLDRTGKSCHLNGLYQFKNNNTHFNKFIQKQYFVILYISAFKAQTTISDPLTFVIVFYLIFYLFSPQFTPFLACCHLLQAVLPTIGLLIFDPKIRETTPICMEQVELA